MNCSSMPLGIALFYHINNSSHPCQLPRIKGFPGSDPVTLKHFRKRWNTLAYPFHSVTQLFPKPWTSPEGNPGWPPCFIVDSPSRRGDRGQKEEFSCKKGIERVGRGRSSGTVSCKLTVIRSPLGLIQSEAD